MRRLQDIRAVEALTSTAGKQNLHWKQQKRSRSLANVTFAEGYQDEKDEVVEDLQKEAVKAAAEADVAVLFLGLPDNFESEGYDRKHMNLPNCQNQLVQKVLEVQKHVIVVLHNGSAVLMPWKDQVEGILEAYLGGEAVGRAVAEVLAGKKNPCGRLAETIPPSSGRYPLLP